MKIRRSRGTGWRYWKATFKAIDNWLNYKSDRSLKEELNSLPRDFVKAIWHTAVICSPILPCFRLTEYLCEHLGIESTDSQAFIAMICVGIILLFCVRIYVWAKEEQERLVSSIPNKALAAMPIITLYFFEIILGTKVFATLLVLALPALCLYALWFYRRLKTGLLVIAITALASILFALHKLSECATSAGKVVQIGLKSLDLREGWGSLLVNTNIRQGYPILIERLKANGDTASALKFAIKAIKKYPDDPEIKDFCRKEFAALMAAPAYAATTKRALAEAYAKNKDNPLLIHFHIAALEEKGDTTALSEALIMVIANDKQQADTATAASYAEKLDKLYAKQGEMAKYKAIMETSMKLTMLVPKDVEHYYYLVIGNKREPSHVATLAKALRLSIASAMEQSDRATALDMEKKLCHLYASQHDTEKYNEAIEHILENGAVDADITSQCHNYVVNAAMGKSEKKKPRETLRRLSAKAQQASDSATAMAYEKLVGELYLLQGDTAKYKATIEKLLKQGYYDAEIMLGYAKHTLNIKEGGDISRPLQRLNAAMSNDPLNPKYTLAKAVLFFLARQYDKALYALQSVDRGSDKIIDQTSLLKLEGDIYLRLSQRPRQSMRRWEDPAEYRSKASTCYKLASYKNPNDKQLQRKLRLSESKTRK